MRLLTAAATGTTGNAFNYKGSISKKYPVDRQINIYGTFSGGTIVTLQAADSDQETPDSGDWYDVPGFDSVTAETHEILRLRASHVRGKVTGGSSDSIDMSIV